MLSNNHVTSRILKLCCDTEGRELTDERRYAPTSVPLRRKPCSRSPETLFHFTGIPIDALTTATARVVPFAYACDDVWHSCSFIGVIGRSATPGACSLSPSLPPEAPSLGRHCPASTVVRASPPPWPARPCPHGSSVGACHAAGRASRVASIPLFHACCRHYPGGTGRCSRRSLPDRWQPSPLFGRVGFRVTRFEACSAFTRVVARVVAEPPRAALCRRSASADVVTSIVRSDCYRLERQLPGGIRTR